MIDTSLPSTQPGARALSTAGAAPAARMLAVFAAALLFCWMAVWNGQPFLHPDTPSYVRGGETAVTTLLGERFATEWTAPSTGAAQGGVADGEVGGGRSIFYALFAWLSAATGDFWLAVFVQSLAAALLLEIVLRGLGRGGLGVYGAAAGMLAVLTPLPFFTGFVMPDVWAGLAIGAAAALFALPGRLTRWDVARLAAVIVFAALAHNSAVLILLALGAAGGLAALLRRGAAPDPRPALAVCGAAVAAAVAGTLAFNSLVERTTGQPPVMPPFLTARVIADGPGLRYVRERCGDARFEVCRYADKLPLAVDHFLWSPELGVYSNASPESRRAMSAEQTRFALAVAAAYPGEQIAATARNIAAQAVRTDLEDFEYLPPFMADMTARVAEPHLSRFTAVRALNRGLPLSLLERIYAAAIFASLVAAALVAARRPAGGAWPRGALFFGLVAAGLLANAGVCGALSATHGRYQARAVWLLPFAAFALAAASRRWSGLFGVRR